MTTIVATKTAEFENLHALGVRITSGMRDVHGAIQSVYGSQEAYEIATRLRVGHHLNDRHVFRLLNELCEEATIANPTATLFYDQTLADAKQIVAALLEEVGKLADGDVWARDARSDLETALKTIADLDAIGDEWRSKAYLLSDLRDALQCAWASHSDEIFDKLRADHGIRPGDCFALLERIKRAAEGDDLNVDRVLDDAGHIIRVTDAHCRGLFGDGSVETKALGRACERIKELRATASATTN